MHVTSQHWRAVSSADSHLIFLQTHPNHWQPQVLCTCCFHRSGALAIPSPYFDMAAPSLDPSCLLGEGESPLSTKLLHHLLGVGSPALRIP